METLETRLLLCQNNLVPGEMLEIVGDDGANTIAVQDAGPRGVTVSCDGRTLVEGAIVDRLNIRTLGGPDTINYRLVGNPDFRPEDHRTLEVLIDTGADADVVRYAAEVSGPQPHFLLSPDRLVIDTGTGPDVLDFNAVAGNFLNPHARGVDAAATIDVRMGSEDDLVAFALGNVIHPFDTPPAGLEVRLDLGADDDTADARFVGTLSVPVRFSARGGDGEGDDRFALFIGNPNESGDPARFNGELTAEFDGGAGRDTALIITGARADAFTVQPGAEANSVQIDVTDIATGAPTVSLGVVDTEDIIVKAGDGDDEFDVTGQIAAGLHLFGQGGDDHTVQGYTFTAFTGGTAYDWDGGDGNDSFAVTTTDAAELIEILGVPDREVPDPRIRVTDKETGQVTFDAMVVGVEDITVEARGGDDEMVLDDSGGPLGGINFHFLGQGGDDMMALMMVAFALMEESELSLPAVDGGDGFDTVLIFGGARADGFAFNPGANDKSARIDVTDIATGSPTASLGVVDTEEIIVKAGDGNDLFDVTLGFAAALQLFGQSGDEIAVLRQLAGKRLSAEADPLDVPPAGPVLLDLGEGTDHSKLVTTDAAELIEILGVPDAVVPDPRIRVTDLATGMVTFEAMVVGTEDITVEARGGDDQIMMDNSGGPLGGINFHLFGQDGDESAAINYLFKTLDEPPEPVGDLDFDGGDGTDGFSLLTTAMDEVIEVFGSRAGDMRTVEVRAGLASGEQTMPVSLANVENVQVKAGDGNDEFDVSGQVFAALHLFGQGGRDTFSRLYSPGISTVSDFRLEGFIDGGEGEDTLLAIGSDLLGERFDIRPSAAGEAVEIGVTDIATGSPTTSLGVVDTEDIIVKAGDGDDGFNVVGPIAADLHLFGQGGDDFLDFLIPLGSLLPPLGHEEDTFDGGDGEDHFQLIATDAAELIEILGVPDREVPDPLIRVTNKQTGEVTFEAMVMGVEDITVETRDGNDDVHVAGLPHEDIDIPDLTQTWTDIHIDTGVGSDELTILSGPRAQRFNIGPGTRGNGAVIDMTDLASGTPTASLGVVDTEQIVVKAGDGDDEFDVTGPIAAALHLFGQGGNETVNFIDFNQLDGTNNLPTGQSLDGGEGEDKFTLVTTNATELIEILGVPDAPVPDPLIRVTDLATGIVTFQAMVVGVEDITVEARGGNDEMVLDDSGGPLGGMEFHLFGQDGDDALTVIDFDDLESFPAPEWQPGTTDWDGGLGADSLHVIGSDASESFMLTESQLTRDGNGDGFIDLKAMYKNVELATLDMAGGQDVIEIGQDTDPAGAIEPCWLISKGIGGASFVVRANPFEELTLAGGPDADFFEIFFGALAGPVFVLDSGRSGRDVVNVYGTAAMDALTLSAGSPLIVKYEGPDLSGTGGGDVRIESIEIAHEGLELLDVDAGASADTIDASMVPVGLHTQLVLRGGDGNDELKGSAGADILLGENGDDFLLGLSGRDLMIGGMGADRLIGNNGDDILIAGFTDYDTHDAALLAIMAEWTSARDYNTRIANLMGTGNGPDFDQRLNGLFFLNDGTVHDDGASDTLTGSGGRDWFLYNADGDGGSQDQVTDLRRDEVATADIDAFFSEFSGFEEM